MLYVALWVMVFILWLAVIYLWVRLDYVISIINGNNAVVEKIFNKHMKELHGKE